MLYLPIILNLSTTFPSPSFGSLDPLTKPPRHRQVTTRSINQAYTARLIYHNEISSLARGRQPSLPPMREFGLWVHEPHRIMHNIARIATTAAVRGNLCISRLGTQQPRGASTPRINLYRNGCTVLGGAAVRWRRPLGGQRVGAWGSQWLIRPPVWWFCRGEDLLSGGRVRVPLLTSFIFPGNLNVRTRDKSEYTRGGIARVLP